MSYIIYVVDCETTGLDHNENDVIEVSFWRLSDDEQKTWLLKALTPATISDQALKKNGHKRDDITWKTTFGKENYLEPRDVICDIESWIMQDEAEVDQRVFLGQNPEFDIKFLRKLWEKCESKDTFPFGHFVIDTIQIARLIDLCTGKRRKFYNLSQLVKDFGVTKGKAHRASEDVKMTRELFLKQFEPIKEFIAKTFENCYTTD